LHPSVYSINFRATSHCLEDVTGAFHRVVLLGYYPQLKSSFRHVATIIQSETKSHYLGEVAQTFRHTHWKKQYATKGGPLKCLYCNQQETEHYKRGTWTCLCSAREL